MKDHQISPEKAGRELLANCYAAFRPDTDWFRNFREKIEEQVGSLEEYSKEARNGLTLQAARRIAQEETMGNPALVRQLSGADLLARAEQEVAEEKEKWEQEKDREISLSQQRARRETIEEIESKESGEVKARSERVARKCIKLFRYVILAMFVLVTLLIISGASGIVWWISELFLAVCALVGLADALGVAIARKFIGSLEKGIAIKYAKFLRPNSSHRYDPDTGTEAP